MLYRSMIVLTLVVFNAGIAFPGEIRGKIYDLPAATSGGALIPASEEIRVFVSDVTDRNGIGGRAVADFVAKGFTPGTSFVTAGVLSVIGPEFGFEVDPKAGKRILRIEFERRNGTLIERTNTLDLVVLEASDHHQINLVVPKPVVSIQPSYYYPHCFTYTSPCRHRLFRR